MLDDHGFELHEENQFPIAYLLTFRTYGTWLPGDSRGSYDREKNIHGSKRIEPNVPLRERMSDLTEAPVLLSESQRTIVYAAITEVCEHRLYGLRAVNVRSNHSHAVVSAQFPPEKIVNDFKAYATRALRREWQFKSDEKIWARGASTRYLWRPKHVIAAVDYVLYSQGEVPFEISGD
jgi:REP element-mobilizing transposase RayT